MYITSLSPNYLASGPTAGGDSLNRTILPPQNISQHSSRNKQENLLPLWEIKVCIVWSGARPGQRYMAHVRSTMGERQLEERKARLMCKMEDVRLDQDQDVCWANKYKRIITRREKKKQSTHSLPCCSFSF